MNHSKKPKKDPKIETLPNRESEEDFELKLEIWENEGGAINQPNAKKKSKEN